MSGKKLPVLFGIHNHQPLGNFDRVVEHLTATCYRPFLKAVSSESAIRLSLHISGPLLLWWERNNPGMLDLVADMVSSGQAELLSGGFYEPVLAAIPRADRREQIQRLSSYLETRLGGKPRGLWLTERVWENQIIEDLLDCGIEYVLVDDRHFLVSGFQEQQLNGYYVTEAEGRCLKVFPIDETMRYLIPFRAMTELERYLRSVFNYGSMAIYMDDGEKLGAWPGTHRWIYEDGWLNDFLENAARWADDFVEWMTFSQVMEKVQPKGICYLPTASYEEMEKWTLPPDRALRLECLIKSLGTQARDVYRPFLRGGHWKNFFVRYPESNLMHKRSIEVSRLSLGKCREFPEMRELALSSQCNDAYWHGIFGGLYLPHLRNATWNALLKAESGLRAGQRISVCMSDVDCDGRDEVRITSGRLSAVIDPYRGGQVRELSFLGAAHNYCNGLTRRHEAYHDVLRETISRGEIETPAGEWEEGIPGIHGLNRVPEKSLLDDLIFDWYERNSFVDHLFDPGATLDDYRRCDFREWGDFANQPFKVQIKDNTVNCSREGGIYHLRGDKKSLTLIKNYAFQESGELVIVSYRLKNTGHETISCRFGVEWNLFPAFLVFGNGDLLVDGVPRPFNETWEADAGSIYVSDRDPGCGLSIRVGQGASLWGFPVETVARSGSGYEKIIQAIAIMAHWSLDLRPGEEWSKKILVNRT